MYYQYFHVVCYLGPVGFVKLFMGRTPGQVCKKEPYITHKRAL